MRVELPGFVDLQVNGFAGVDFNAPGLTADEFHRGCAAIRATGVTRFLPTLITSTLDTFSALARTIADIDDASIAGIHMEGPYICPEDGPRGAHPRPCVVAASRDDFARRQDAARGRIVLVTLAPEIPGALALIEYLAGQGVRVAIAHSAATPEQVRAAVSAGATLSTHLGNGCAATLPRHPNLIWEQLATDELIASFIVDGHHLPPATVKAMIRAKTPQRTILVTDAMAAAGCAPGTYKIGGAHVDLSPAGRVSLTGTPYLAGAALAMPDAIANTVRFTGLPLEEVVPMATSRPADYIGIPVAGRVRGDWDPQRCTLSITEIRDDA